MKMIVKIGIKGLVVALALPASLTLAACNTIHGAGQDIEKGGEAIQHCSDQDGNGCKD